MDKDSFSSAVSEGMGKASLERKLPPAAEEVAAVIRQAAREISKCYACRICLSMLPIQDHETWVSLWCRSSSRWNDSTKFLTIVVFEGAGVSGHVSSNSRKFVFSDLATFRVALLEFFRSPECGRVMREMLNYGRSRR